MYRRGDMEQTGVTLHDLAQLGRYQPGLSASPAWASVRGGGQQ